MIRTWGEPRQFDFPARDHVAIAEALDLVDFEAGSKVAGQKFYFLKNDAVLLELALVQFAMSILIKEGYTPIITPDVTGDRLRSNRGNMISTPRRRPPTGPAILNARRRSMLTGRSPRTPGRAPTAPRSCPPACGPSS